MKIPSHILPVIVLAQFCCTSLWFASNGILDDIAQLYGLAEKATAHLTSAVQLGFILGTLLFAFLSLADRYSSTRIFFICAVLGSVVNLGMLWQSNNITSLLIIRGLTGFFLAGIYPVGMKIASDHYEKGLGKSLGFLVGALVLGTAFPHLLKATSFDGSWQTVVMITSGLAFLGGLILYVTVPNKPYQLTTTQWEPTAFLHIFRHIRFRKAAFGYFGHMWELYAFWTFIPWLLTAYQKTQLDVQLNTSLWSFMIIGAGGLGCILSGFASEKIGARKTALGSLSVSGVLCLLSPLLFYASPVAFITILMIWGAFVVSDSPMFSTLVATEVQAQHKATALTIVNCIGFSITIVSVQLLSYLAHEINPKWVFMMLALGPIVGLILNMNSEAKEKKQPFSN